MNPSDEKEKMTVDESTFAALEMDFQEVLQELTGDRSLEKFKLEYEKLHKALTKSHESEKRLMQKCRELNAEIAANNDKVKRALALSKEDQDTIQTLKLEIEKAWKTVDAAHEKEQRGKETIQSLKLEISNLSKLVEQGAGLNMGQEHSVNELLKVKDELISERDQLYLEMEKLREDLELNREKQAELEAYKTEADLKMHDLHNEIQTQRMDAQKEARRLEHLELNLKQTKDLLDQKELEMKSMEQRTDKFKSEYNKLEKTIRDQKTTLSKLQTENDNLNGKSAKLQHDYENQIVQNDFLANENAQRVQELKLREDEINGLKNDTNRVAKLRETVQRKLRQVEDQRISLEQEKDLLKNKIISYEKDIELYKKQADNQQKKIEELTKNRDALNKNLVKTALVSQQQMTMFKTHEANKKNLQMEIGKAKQESQKQRAIILTLEKERDRYITETSDITQKVLQLMEEVKIREMLIYDLKKKVAETETKLRQQQNLYEAARTDRNVYSKNLIESKDEIEENERKLKMMNHQIDQLKEEILGKENALVKEHTDHLRVEKEKDNYKADLQRMKQQAAETKAFIKAQEAEARKLLDIIQKADLERQKQRKCLDQVIAERDILGTQLVRRNDEMGLLYEKIKIQKSTLTKGELQYAERLEDIRILKLEIKRLKREKMILSKKLNNLNELKKEIFIIEKELLREKTKTRALEEELESPMNVHRWRKLEGNDPAAYELIIKIQTLQKHLIKKTEQLIEKGLQLEEKEKLYIELKEILARQPGPEVTDQLSLTQSQLKQRMKQLKSLTSELNMRETQLEHSQFEVDKLNTELHELKRKYFKMKQEKERRESEVNKIKKGQIQQNPPPPVADDHDIPKFIGGGFNLRANGRQTNQSNNNAKINLNHNNNNSNDIEDEVNGTSTHNNAVQIASVPPVG
ncbi:hypothetical protein SNEBB_002149 [Seison nebaliae]|nr:hypothetical protein SNEBB_002149 [Seison nebaliae]